MIFAARLVLEKSPNDFCLSFPEWQGGADEILIDVSHVFFGSFGLSVKQAKKNLASLNSQTKTGGDCAREFLQQHTSWSV
jgi:hypothetical protein